MLLATYCSLALGLLVAPLALYLGLLALLARRPTAPPSGAAPATRFAIVVPAHDEERQIARTVASLLAVDYPANMRRVVVIADNCTDHTAERASDAGALVWVRTDRERRGKGYALEYAFERLLAEDDIDALVVVDADTEVTANLLGAFDARLRAGAAAVQAEYGVSNVHASWRTRLMTLALAMFHRTRSLARERLRLSCGLRGNGMCFASRLLRDHPHHAYGLVEDVEYGITIGRAGTRVWYAAEAEVRGEMVSTSSAARSQRERWEGGRVQLLRLQLPGLVRDALRQRSAMLCDLALDLVVPPLSTLTAIIALGLVGELVLALLQGRLMPSAVPWLASSAALGLYVGRGMQHSGLGWRAVTTLAWAPVFIAWKLLFTRPLARRSEWVRTRREPGSPP